MVFALSNFLHPRENEPRQLLCHLGPVGSLGTRQQAVGFVDQRRNLFDAIRRRHHGRNVVTEVTIGQVGIPFAGGHVGLGCRLDLLDDVRILQCRMHGDAVERKLRVLPGSPGRQNREQPHHKEGQNQHHPLAMAHRSGCRQRFRGALIDRFLTVAACGGVRVKRLKAHE